MGLALSEQAADADAWIGLARAGDLGAWRGIYDRYLPLVYRVAQRLGVADRDLGDVCQEVFLRVYRGLGSFRGEAQFHTWLYRITLNEAARHGRRGSVRRAWETLLGREQGPPPPRRPDEVMERVEAGQVLGQVLAGMRPKQRQVFVLFELEERPLGEIAEILGCGLETVRSRLRHARAEFGRLRRQAALGEGGR